MKKNEWYLFMSWKHNRGSITGWEVEEFTGRRGVENRLAETMEELHAYRIIQGKEYRAKVLEVEIEEMKY